MADDTRTSSGGTATGATSGAWPGGEPAGVRDAYDQRPTK